MLNLHYYHDKTATWRSAGSLHGVTLEDAAARLRLADFAPYCASGKQWSGHRNGVRWVVTKREV